MNAVYKKFVFLSFDQPIGLSLSSLRSCFGLSLDDLIEFTGSSAARNLLVICFHVFAPTKIIKNFETVGKSRLWIDSLPFWLKYADNPDIITSGSNITIVFYLYSEKMMIILLNQYSKSH